jgi:hypothetical protein
MSLVSLPVRSFFRQLVCLPLPLQNEGLVPFVLLSGHSPGSWVPGACSSSPLVAGKKSTAWRRRTKLVRYLAFGPGSNVQRDGWWRWWSGHFLFLLGSISLSGFVLRKVSFHLSVKRIIIFLLRFAGRWRR